MRGSSLHRRTRKSARLRVAGAILIAIVAATLAYAIDDVELRFDVVHGGEWQAERVHARLEMTPSGQRAHIEIDSVHLMAWPKPIRNVTIHCPHLEIGPRELACRSAQVHADVPALGRQMLAASLRYGRADGALELDLHNVRLGTGTAAVRASLREAQWRIRASLDRVPLTAIAELAHEVQIAIPFAIATGSATLQADVTGAGAQLSHVRSRGTLEALTLNNDSGSIATDGLAARFDIDLKPSNAEWLFQATLASDHGQGYLEPVFLDFGMHALEIAARGRASNSALFADHIRVSHTGVLEAQANAVEIDLEHAQPVRALELDLASMHFPGAYETYLQPFLLDTSFKALRTSGQVAGTLALANGEPQRIELALRQIDAEGEQPALALRGLNGRWYWRAGEGRTMPASYLAWTGGHVYGLDFGASQLEFVTTGRRFELLSPASMPLLDGSLELSTLLIQDIGSQDIGFNVDATLHPISVSLLCRAFGWPQFGGRVSGSISNLELKEDVLTLGTRLEAQVFDGLLTIRDLRLDEPFGAWPRLFANIDLAKLDLDLLTSAFSFGRITGRLSGAIHGLELFNWQPVAFDARLYTSPGRTRQRISQRAVQNIGSIGGGGAGVAAALSSGFLRFFEEFNYARLGITCKLENEVCEMGGVGPAPNGGYYLVQGRGLPRIDVIGNARRVDWPRLVGQLAAATASSGPVVD